MTTKTLRRRRSGRAKTAVGTLVRAGGPADLTAVSALAASLWPEGTIREHRGHMRAVLSGTPPSTLPLVVIVAECAGKLVGFVEVGLRSHADGCDPRWPVGFVEGWFVVPGHRGQHVGRRLMKAAEGWARARGCRELASDTWSDNQPSQRAHQALGFAIVSRCTNFRKALPRRR